MTDYAELRAAMDAGPTPGLWKSHEYGVGEFYVYADLPDEQSVTVVFVDDDIRYSVGNMEQQGRDVAFIAAASPEAIRALLAERDAQAAEIARLRMAAQAADDALTMYERYGEICAFEGESMIHAATLIALGDLARTALTQQEQGK